MKYIHKTSSSSEANSIGQERDSFDKLDITEYRFIKKWDDKCKKWVHILSYIYHGVNKQSYKAGTCFFTDTQALKCKGLGPENLTSIRYYIDIY